MKPRAAAVKAGHRFWALLGLLAPRPPGSLDGGEHNVTLRRVGTAPPLSEEAPALLGGSGNLHRYNAYEHLDQWPRDHRLRRIPFVNGRLRLGLNDTECAIFCEAFSINCSFGQ